MNRYLDSDEPPRPSRRDTAIAIAFIVLFVLAASVIPGGGLPR